MDEWGEGKVTPFGMRADLVVVVVQKKVGVLWPEKKRKARSGREGENDDENEGGGGRGINAAAAVVNNSVDSSCDRFVQIHFDLW